jgi:hypothetical protein
MDFPLPLRVVAVISTDLKNRLSPGANTIVVTAPSYCTPDIEILVNDNIEDPEASILLIEHFYESGMHKPVMFSYDGGRYYGLYLEYENPIVYHSMILTGLIRDISSF